jgi:hypothetical protein
MLETHVAELVAQIRELLERNDSLSSAWADVEEQRREHLAALEAMEVRGGHRLGRPIF